MPTKPQTPPDAIDATGHILPVTSQTGEAGASILPTDASLNVDAEMGLVEQFRNNVFLSSLIRGGALNHLTDEEWRALLNAAGVPALLRTKAEDADRIGHLNDRLVETQMLAHQWMKAHDCLHAGKPYEFPSPADLPDRIAEDAKLIAELRSVIGGAFQAITNAAETTNDQDTAATMFAEQAKIDAALASLPDEKRA